VMAMEMILEVITSFALRCRLGEGVFVWKVLFQESDSNSITQCRSFNYNLILSEDT
jgi:hypothetical protein